MILGEMTPPLNPHHCVFLHVHPGHPGLGRHERYRTLAPTRFLKPAPVERSLGKRDLSFRSSTNLNHNDNTTHLLP
jgi:hypothetical protein